MPGRGALTPVVSRAAAGWAAVVSRFPCLRGRGPPLKESRLACIPITALRLSPASTLRAAPHAIDRHSYRNAYADCSSSWWPHPAPAPAASLRLPSSRPAAGHADLIRWRPLSCEQGNCRIRTRDTQLLRSGPVRPSAGGPALRLWPSFALAADWNHETQRTGTKAPRSCTPRFPPRLLTGSSVRCPALQEILTAY